MEFQEGSKMSFKWARMPHTKKIEPKHSLSNENINLKKKNPTNKGVGGLK